MCPLRRGKSLNEPINRNRPRCLASGDDAAVTNDKGERIYLRQTRDPEPFHLETYWALGLPAKPLKTKRLKKM